MPRQPTGRPRGRPAGTGRLATPRRITVWLHGETYTRLKADAAGRTGARGGSRPLAAYVREAIEHYLICSQKRRTQPPTEPWSAVGQTPVQPYTPEDFQAIAKVLGVSHLQLSTLQVSLPGITVSEGKVLETFPLNDALEQAAKYYFVFVHHMDKAPRLAVRLQVLQALRTDVQTLAEAVEAVARDLEHLDDASRADIIRRRHSPRSAFDLLTEVEGAAAQWETSVWITLRPFVKHLESTIHALGTDTGRPGEDALRSFINILCHIYPQVPGKSLRLSPHGPLFRFVRTCLTPLIWQHPDTVGRWDQEQNAQALYWQIRTVYRRIKAEQTAQTCKP